MIVLFIEEPVLLHTFFAMIQQGGCVNSKNNICFRDYFTQTLDKERNNDYLYY